MAAAKGAPAAFEVPDGLVPAPPPKAITDELKRGAGRAVFTSSRSHQRSWVRPDGTMSLYTYHLIEALQGANNRPGDKAVTLANLMKHLGQTVPESARKLCKAEQVPFFDTAAEDFAVALLRGGKGLPAGGWPSVEKESQATIGQIVQAIGERAIAVRGDVSGVIIAGDRNQVTQGREREILGFERRQASKKGDRGTSKGLEEGHADETPGAESRLPQV